MGKAIKRRTYTKADREQACIEHSVTGSYTQTSKALNIPESTIRLWADSEWWVELSARVCDEKTSQQRATYSKIIDLAQQVQIDKLPQATAQQAATISGIAFDKTRLIDNQPTSISSNTGDMKALVSKFQAMADTYKEKQVNVVQTIEKVKEP